MPCCYLFNKISSLFFMRHCCFYEQKCKCLSFDFDLIVAYSLIIRMRVFMFFLLLTKDSIDELLLISLLFFWSNLFLCWFFCLYNLSHFQTSEFLIKQFMPNNFWHVFFLFTHENGLHGANRRNF